MQRNWIRCIHRRIYVCHARFVQHQLGHHWPLRAQRSAGETNDAVRDKLHAALASGLYVLLCCGESLEVRESGAHFDWVQNQLSHALEGLSNEAMDGVVVAYEPIWAIGTGKTASSQQAQEMHTFIRTWLTNRFDESTAQACRILYGGSCKRATRTSSLRNLTSMEA